MFRHFELLNFTICANKKNKILSILLFEKENCFYHSRKECYEIPEPKIIKETHSIAGELMNGSEEGAKTL